MAVPHPSLHSASTPGSGAGRVVRAALALILTLWFNSAARAQTGFETEPFRPTGESTGMLTVWSADTPPHLAWSAGAWLDVGFGAVRLAVPELNLPERDIVQWRTDLRITGVIGLFDRFAAGFELPWVLLEKGLDTGFTQTVVGHQGFTNGHIGDLSLFGEARLTQQIGSMPAIAGGLRMRFPSGSPATLGGEPGVVIEPIAMATWSFGPHALTINLAYRLRTVPMRLTVSDPATDPPTFIRNVQIGHEIAWGIAGQYALAIPPYSAPQALLAEISGVLPTLDHSGPGERLGLEARIALRQSSLTQGDSSLNLTFGIGVGIVRTPGMPLLRGFLGIGFASEHPWVDDDGDGIPNRRDTCRRLEEDFDGFEDGDGCPEDDNDGDGIEDLDDDCPDQAEDQDDIDDWDGCPDPDVPDDDHDGMLGSDDRCPEAAEDYDGFQDDDGCPEPDNDQDGLPDLNDVCPDAAEDMNNFEDEDGCPDNGSGARMFAIEDNRVRLFRQLLFRSESTELTWRSLRVLDQLASMMRSRSEISRLQITVHARRRARRWHRLARALAEGIEVELRKRGIGGDRLRVGPGEWGKARAGKIEITVQIDTSRARRTAPAKGDAKKKKKRKRKRKR